MDKSGRLLLLAPIAWLGGCQTVMNGVSQPVAVRTDPAGAVVAVEGVPTAVTPATIRLPRGRDTTVTITKLGFRDESILFTTAMDGNIVGTLLSGAIVGGVVDLATGAAFKLSPDKIDLTLRATDARPAEPPRSPTPIAPPALAAVEPASAPDDRSPVGRLRALERLRAERLISEDEYVTVRQQILADLAEASR